MKNKYLKLFLFTIVLAYTVVAQEVVTITEPFNASGGVTLDANGNIFVADFGAALNNANGSKVYKVYRDGTIEEFAGGFLGASGNTFDSHGNYLQSNIAGQRITKITPSGDRTNLALGEVLGPVGVVTSSQNEIFIADCATNRIVRISNSGVVSTLASGSEFACPNGLTIDENNNLYTCNFGNGDIVKITPARDVSILATIPSDRCGHLTYSNGFLYVVGRCSNQIYRVSLSGDIQLIAGTGERGNTDGPALEATFNLPNGIAASADGDTLFINDAVSLDGDCTSTPLNPVVLRMITGINSITGVGEKVRANFPDQFILEQNYPNPFNPTTKISFSIPLNVETHGHESLQLIVYDVLGREVATLLNKPMLPGIYEVEFDGSELPSGIYFYTLTANGKTEIKKMTLLK